MASKQSKAQSDMEPRKVVLFLVEGKSEIETLQYPFELLFEKFNDNYIVEFQLREGPKRKNKNNEGGDITTESNVSADNIRDRIYEQFIIPFYNRTIYNPIDICQVYQIVDMDGACLPDERIRNDSKYSKPYYDIINNCILTSNVDGIIRRNNRKKGNLKSLFNMKTLKIEEKTNTKKVLKEGSIDRRRKAKNASRGTTKYKKVGAEDGTPYQVYYFSCNLDHFLYNEANLDPNQKTAMAKNFMLENLNENDPLKYFQVFLNDPDVFQEKFYHKSWTFIMDENQSFRSIQRHTNINLLLEDIKKFWR